VPELPQPHVDRRRSLAQVVDEPGPHPAVDRPHGEDEQHHAGDRDADAQRPFLEDRDVGRRGAPSLPDRPTLDRHPDRTDGEGAVADRAGQRARAAERAPDGVLVGVPAPQRLEHLPEGERPEAERRDPQQRLPGDRRGELVEGAVGGVGAALARHRDAHGDGGHEQVDHAVGHEADPDDDVERRAPVHVTAPPGRAAEQPRPLSWRSLGHALTLPAGGAVRSGTTSFGGCPGGVGAHPPLTGR
jgi:hypothetical protein